MKLRLVSSVTVAAALAAVLYLFPAPAAAQKSPSGSKFCSVNGALVPCDTPEQQAAAKANSLKAATGPKKWCLGCSVDGKTTPRTPDGHPDFSGFWDIPFQGVVEKRTDGSYGYFLGAAGPAPKPANPSPAPEQPSYKPEYAAKVKGLVDHEYGPTTSDDPVMDCKPLGVPRVMLPPLQIIQTPGLVAILYESNVTTSTYRLIYTDGRPHQKDADPSYLGDSIGHWEGDTLIVDVVNLNDDSWLGGGQQGEGTSKYAIFHSDQEHVIERYSRQGDTLTYEATVEDPVMLTKPWVIAPRRFKHGGPDDELMDNYCQNHDKGHFVAPTEEDHYVPGKSF
jgi:hypothetical protein